MTARRLAGRAVPQIGIVNRAQFNRLRLRASGGAFALSGGAADLHRAYALPAAAGTLVLGGQGVSLLKASRLAAGAGSVVLGGQSAVLGRALPAGAGSFALGGQNAVFRRDLRLAADAGSFALGGQDAALTYVPGISLVAFNTRPGTVSGEFTAQMPMPAGAAAGDIGVLFDRVVDGSNPATVVPSGWTQVAGVAQTTGTHRANIRISYKKLVAGDLGGALSTMTGAQSMRKALLVFRLGTGAINTVTAGGWNAVCADGDPSGQNVAASGGAAPLIVFACGGSYGGDPLHSFSFSPSADATIGTDNNEFFVAYKAMFASPADVAVDLSDTGDAVHLASGYLALST